MATASVGEGDGVLQSAWIRAPGSGPQAFTASITYSSGTAIIGEDFQATSPQTISFGEEDNGPKFTTSSIIDDELVEPDETYTASAGSGGFYDITITDNDVANISVSSVSAQEGDGVVQFTITLSNAVSRDVTITYATADGTALAGQDYQAATNGTLVIPAGSTSTTVDVALISDDSSEEVESFSLSVVSATAEDIRADQFVAGSVGEAIIEDSQPTLSIVDNVTGAEGGALAFQVSLSAALDRDLLVSFATSNGSAFGGQDYVAASSSITIPAGSTSALIFIQTLDDGAVETTFESFRVDIGSTDQGVILGTASSLAFIRDNDLPTEPPDDDDDDDGPGRSDDSSTGGNNLGGPGGKEVVEQAKGGGNPGSNNRAPVAEDDVLHMKEGTTLTFSVEDLLKNDTDRDAIDRGKLKVTEVSASPELLFFPDAGELAFMPPEDFHGAVTFTYRVSDPKGGNDVGQITVLVENDDFDFVKMDVDYLFPNKKTVDHHQEVVPQDGPELIDVGGALTLDIFDDMVRIDFNTTQTFQSVAFSGFHLKDTGGLVPKIKGVEIEENTVTGFDASDIQIGPNDIWINLAGVSFTSQSSILLHVDLA